MKNINEVILVIGGCTGSNSPQAIRFQPAPKLSTSILSRPLNRSEFGTHTTSLAILDRDLGIIIDNGSGVGQASEFLRAENPSLVVMLQTHYHLDHTDGMPNNSLLFQKKIPTVIYGPKLSPQGSDMLRAMDRMFDPANWPVSPKMFGINHDPKEFDPATGALIVSGPELQLMLCIAKLNHPGGSVAYRIPTRAGDIVIATDNELSNDDILGFTADFISGAELVYLDCQYRDSEYEGTAIIGTGDTVMVRKGWGHSTPNMIAAMLGVTAVIPKRILIGHHDPKRPDGDLFVFEGEVKRQLEGAFDTKVEFAREGSLISLPVLETAEVEA
jgi:phosphoribosyl 1,2-cyclic phosphodiesterase